MHRNFSIALLLFICCSLPVWADEPKGNGLPEGAVARFVVSASSRNAAMSPVIESLAWGPSGRTLALAVSSWPKKPGEKDDGAQYSIRLWDVVTGMEKKILGEGSCVAYSPDGSLIAWGGGWGDTVHVALTATGQPVRDIKSGIGTHGLAFSPDGRTLATAAGGFGSAVTLWDLTTGKELLTPKGSFACFAFAPDGTSVALGGTVEGDEKMSVSVCDRRTGKVRFSNRHEATMLMAEAMSYSSDGKVLAATGDKATVVWDAATGKELARLGNDGAFGRALAFHPSRKLLAICCWDEKAAQRGQIRIWDLETKKQVMELAGHPKGTTCLAFSLRGQFLASGGADGTVILWKMAR